MAFPVHRAVLASVALLVSFFIHWSFHRSSLAVIIEDPSWPRGAPYPDSMIKSLHDTYDGWWPPPPRTLEYTRKWPHVRLTFGILAFLFYSVATALWWPWIQRGLRKVDDTP